MSKSDKSKDEFLGIWQKRLYIFIAVCGIIYGASTQVWGIILKPKVQAEIKTAVIPIIIEIQEIKDLLVYQNIATTVRADSSEKAEILLTYTAWKKGKGK